MFGIFKRLAALAPKTPLVAGLRLFGQDRVFWFDTLFARRQDRPILTIGRDANCDICLPDPTVSSVQGTIRRRAHIRGDSVAPRFMIYDAGSTNGIRVSALGADGPFGQVDAVALSVGLHVRIGAIILVAVDGRGACPIIASTELEFIGQACALYGSEETAARFIGISVRHMRKLLARSSASAARS